MITPEFVERFSLQPVCTSDEIDRIFNIKTAQDHLLKLRADTIHDHMRLFRVYRNKALDSRKSWSLESSFSNTHYTSVLSKLPRDKREICSNITYGDMFSDDPNGMIFSTSFGVITTISDSLKYFSLFSNLALLNFSTDIPQHIRMNALRIALRVMLRTESLDFYMDPRGIIPPQILSAINEPIFNQLQFLAGHEFSHYILGHLDEDNTAKQAIFHSLSADESEPMYKPQKVYTTSQQQELDADINSLKLPKYSNRQRLKILNASLLWFVALELYEVAKDTISPRCPWIPTTHPSARERFDHLLSEMKFDDSYKTMLFSNRDEVIDIYSDFIQEDISTNYEVYEQYGSIYLDEPNSEWRGKALIDRVDYY